MDLVLNVAVANHIWHTPSCVPALLELIMPDKITRLSGVQTKSHDVVSSRLISPFLFISSIRWIGIVSLFQSVGHFWNKSIGVSFISIWLNRDEKGICNCVKDKRFPRLAKMASATWNCRNIGCKEMSPILWPISFLTLDVKCSQL